MQGSCVVTLGAPNVLLRMEAAPSANARAAASHGTKKVVLKEEEGLVRLFWPSGRMKTFPLWLGLCIASGI